MDDMFAEMAPSMQMNMILKELDRRISELKRVTVGLPVSAPPPPVGVHRRRPTVALGD